LLISLRQKQIITSYLTNNPKLEAVIELKKITTTLCETSESYFNSFLDVWHTRWSSFLKKKTEDPETGGWHIFATLPLLDIPELQKHLIECATAATGQEHDRMVMDYNCQLECKLELGLCKLFPVASHVGATKAMAISRSKVQ